MYFRKLKMEGGLFFLFFFIISFDLFHLTKFHLFIVCFSFSFNNTVTTLIHTCALPCFVWTLCLRGTTGQCSISLSDCNRICHHRQPHAPFFHAQNQDFLFSLGFTILSSIPQLSNLTVRLFKRQKKKTNNSVVCTLGKKWIVYHDRSKTPVHWGLCQKQ